MFEHLRINVANKEETAQWYIDNLGLEIIPSYATEYIYVADKDRNFMLELSDISGIRNQYFDVPLDAIHMAFEGHQTIEAVAEKTLANGGLQEGITTRNPLGDYVFNVRDPNGFVVQLMHRVNSFFSKPIKSNIRYEHVAFNCPDQKTSALWLLEFMDLRLVWSKDMDATKNNYRNYRVPFVGDSSRNMSIELYAKPEVEMAFAKMTHEECHIAFASDDPEKMATRMTFGGAKMIGEVQRSVYGDVIVDMRDPDGCPLRLIKRKMPILVAYS